MHGLRFFQAAELQRCRDLGECCQCGLCCFAYRVVIPDPQSEDSKVKLEGRPCPYQKINEAGAYDCLLFGKEERPEACVDWRGDESYGNLMVMVRFRLERPRDENTVTCLMNFDRAGALVLFREQVGPDLAPEDLKLLNGRK